MANIVHKNSKIVFIKRAAVFAQRAQSPEIEEYFSNAVRELGSYWAGKGSTEVGTGLTIGERKLLMPWIIDTEDTDREFKKKVSDYFHALTTKVTSKGVSLEIGLEISNDEPVSATNMPISVSDYVKYKHACSHPDVVLSKEDAAGNQLAKFFIYDPTLVSRKSKEETDLQDKALLLYLEVKVDGKKVTRLLKLQGVDPRPLSADERIERLKLLATKTPEKFIGAVNDKDGEVKYAIESLVDIGALKLIGTSFIIKDTGTTFAHSMDEAVIEWQKPSNKELIEILKTKLVEAVRNNKARTKAEA